MLTATEILRVLDQRGVTRTELGKVLGISQPNATRLYSPDPRSQKLRDLTYEEGRKLIEHYKLEDKAAPIAEPVYLNEELLAPIVQEIARLARSEQGELPARPLASALSRYLRQIAERPAIHASQDALEAVAQAAVPPLH